MLRSVFENVRANSRDAGTANPPRHYLMTHGDEIYAVTIRDVDVLQEKASKGVEWLDTQRYLLQEYNEWIGIFYFAGCMVSAGMVKDNLIGINKSMPSI